MLYRYLLLSRYNMWSRYYRIFRYNTFFLSRAPQHVVPPPFVVPTVCCPAAILDVIPLFITRTYARTQLLYCRP